MAVQLELSCNTRDSTTRLPLRPDSRAAKLGQLHTENWASYIHKAGPATYTKLGQLHTQNWISYINKAGPVTYTKLGQLHAQSWASYIHKTGPVKYTKLGQLHTQNWASYIHKAGPVTQNACSLYSILRRLPAESLKAVSLCAMCVRDYTR